MESLASQARKKLSEFINQEISNTVWAFAKLAIWNVPLLHSLAAAALRNLEDLSPQDLSSMAWSFAAIGWWDYPLLDSISSSALPPLEQFGPQGLANMAWAFATSPVLDCPLLAAISARALRTLSDPGPAGGAFIPCNIAMLAWSFAGLPVPDAPLLAALSSAALPTLAQYHTQNLANLSWAFAKILVQDGPLRAAISAASIRRMGEFGGQGLSNLPWAFATLLFHDEPLLESLSAAALAKIADFSTQQLSNTPWSVAKLMCLDAPLLDALSSASLRKIAELSQQDMSSSAWACAALELRNEPLLESIAAQAIRKMAQFECLGIMCTAWAFSVLELSHMPLLDAIAASSIPTIRDFDVQALSLPAWAFSSMRVLDLPLMNAIASESIRRLSQMELHHLSKLAWSFSFLARPFHTCSFLGLLLPVILENVADMNSPGAHSILWGLWQSGFRDPLSETLHLWRAARVSVDDLAGAADLLIMDAEWRREGRERGYLEMLEATVPNRFIQGTVSKWVRGYVVDEAVAVHAWDLDKVERNKPELAKYLTHFPEMEKWSQPGAGNHWRKLGALVEHIDALADVATSPGMPMSMILLMERFAEGSRQWLKVAGGAKAGVLRDAVGSVRWRPWEVLLECGAFIGYSSMRFAMLLRRLGGALAVGVEVDPVQGCIARHFIDLGGCSNIAEVWIGQFRDVLGRPVEEFGALSLKFVFLDYKGTAFHIDLATLETLNAPAPGACAVADNVVLPGAPLFLWAMTRHAAWATCVWALEEFLEPTVEDWMSVSVHCAPFTVQGPATPAPPGWSHLSWHTDHMRRRAQGMRPGESGMSEFDRALYAQHIRNVYRAAGIEAMPWAEARQ